MLFHDKLEEVRIFFTAFSSAQLRQTSLFFLGVFCFKYSRESTSIGPYALHKFDIEGDRTGIHVRSFSQYGVLELSLQISMILGSLLVAPLVKRWRFPSVLACFASLLALTIIVLIILETATGGKIKPKEEESTIPSYYGDYSPYALTPFFSLIGFIIGVVYTMQKTVPRQIAGGDAPKLRFINAAEQTVYELAAIAGALCAALLFIPRLGANLPIASAIFAVLAGLTWYLIRDAPSPETEQKESSPGNNQDLGKDLSRCQRLWIRMRTTCIKVTLPLQSLWQGAKITCTNRQLVWLVMAYTLTQYSHVMIETFIALIIGQRYFGGDPRYTQTIIAGSNIGEFCGAVAMLFLQPRVSSPLPWVRLNAIMLMLIWIFPAWCPTQRDSGSAWIAAAIVLPLGATWSAAAVSFYSYMQTLLSDEAPTSSTKTLPPLSSVVGFLFTVETILQASALPLLGMYIDKTVKRTGTTDRSCAARTALKYVGGVHFTVLAVLIVISTLIPRGALSLRSKACMPNEELKDRDQEER
ncbi:hypothetical protein MMC10_003910 [Thelotrema lepadinum]|nr:hypothetical protein [Thelotrema lepadinum]